VKYGVHSGQLGQPFSEVTESMYRHLLQWQQGDADEDHLAAIIFGARASMHYQEMIRPRLRGKKSGSHPAYGARSDWRC